MSVISIILFSKCGVLNNSLFLYIFNPTLYSFGVNDSKKFKFYKPNFVKLNEAPELVQALEKMGWVKKNSDLS